MQALSTFAVLCSGCRKDFVNPAAPGEIRYADLRTMLRPYPLKVLSFCVNSLTAFQVVAGSKTMTIDAVELGDGTIIKVGQSIISMHYTASAKEEAYSLFRSQFSVDFNIYGYRQTSFMDAWSLGCVYVSSAVPPFTNIKMQDRILQINTSFIWPVAPHSGKQISHLIIE